VTFAFLQQPAVAQPSSGEPLSTPVLLSVEKVVANLVRMNSQRAQALRSYQGLRTYRVEYRGFPSSRSAEMVVAITYHAPGTKEFTIESATGSKLIIEKVFKKALQSEKEALETDNQERTALNNDNYIFRMVGTRHCPATQGMCWPWNRERTASSSIAAQSGWTPRILQ